ncbi:unnamed protein product, partial [Allacma fusca]
ERKSQSEGDAGSTSTNSHEARDEPQVPAEIPQKTSSETPSE